MSWYAWSFNIPHPAQTWRKNNLTKQFNSNFYSTFIHSNYYSLICHCLCRFDFRFKIPLIISTTYVACSTYVIFHVLIILLLHSTSNTFYLFTFIYKLIYHSCLWKFILMYVIFQLIYQKIITHWYTNIPSASFINIIYMLKRYGHRILFQLFNFIWIQLLLTSGI